jgi:hypothetical protein
MIMAQQTLALAGILGQKCFELRVEIALLKMNCEIEIRTNFNATTQMFPTPAKAHCPLAQ